MSGPRHRRGSPPNPRPQPRPPADVHQREQAARLDAEAPGWVVTYGPWSRRFMAFAAWPVPHGVIVDSATPEGLVAAMRDAEAEHGAALFAPAWGRDRQSQQAGWDRPWP